MLRIVLAYRGHSTRENPEVLYAGHDGEAAQAALDSAGEGYTRFSTIQGAIERKAKPTTAKEGQPPACPTPAPAEAPATDIAQDLEPTIPKKTRK
jgi:hypothetical protein